MKPGPLLLAVCGGSACLLALVAPQTHGPAWQTVVHSNTTGPLIASAPAASVPAKPALDPPEPSVELAIRARAEQDPIEAAALLAELPGSLSPALAAVVASSWGKHHPDAAALWARSQPERSARDEALFSLSADWAATNPLAAAECALTSLSERRQEQMLGVVGMEWGRQDPAAALAWAQPLVDQSARDSFLAGLSTSLGESSPTKAAALVASLAPGKLQDETALTVILEWGRLEPQAAAEWLRLFPAGPLRQTALENLVSLWAEPSPPDSLSPLHNWPPGPERDQAIRYFLDQVVEFDPSRGLELLPAIEDTDLRQEESERLVQHWLVQDPQAARQWLAGAPISQETRLRLIGTQPQRETQ